MTSICPKFNKTCTCLVVNAYFEFELGEGQRDNQEEYVDRDDFSFGNRGGERENGGGGGVDKVGGENKVKVMPPTSVMTRLILIMVWRKLIRNPNTYSSLIGLTWSLVSFRYNIKQKFHFILHKHIILRYFHCIIIPSFPI